MRPQYLTCQNYDFRYDVRAPLPKQHCTKRVYSFAFALTIPFVRSQLQKGLRPRRSVRTAMAKEINMYATVQKDEMGLDKAVEDVKYMMSRYSVT